MERTDTDQFYSVEARSEAFGYTCNRCLRCCIEKNIQVNPYEIARLAKNLGISTTEMREKYTEDSLGVILDHRDDGSCVFLGPEGCTVHPDRPLVCRLYPLGRTVMPGTTEGFVHAEPHPQTLGIYSKVGTIGDFLNAQETELFIEAADQYFLWVCKATDQLNDDADSASDKSAGFELLDMDKAIAAHCSESGAEQPTDIELRKTLHLTILDETLTG